MLLVFWKNSMNLRSLCSCVSTLCSSKFSSESLLIRSVRFPNPSKLLVSCKRLLMRLRLVKPASACTERLGTEFGINNELVWWEELVKSVSDWMLVGTAI